MHKANLSLILTQRNNELTCSSTFTSCDLCTTIEWTLWKGKLLTGGAWTDSCTDTNCMYCNSDKAVCTHCNNGYVLTGGNWVEETCLVTNCNDCADSTATDCIKCDVGYFLSGSTTCTTCLNNWLDCSAGTTCNTCSPGYVLSQDGSSCLTEWPAGEYVTVTRLANPIGTALEKQQCQKCHTSCKECINASGVNQCTKCALGKYLAVQDSTTLQGTCNDKAAYSSNDDIYIYVSNSATDYAKAMNLHQGTKDNPDIDLMKAIRRAKSMVAPYSTKNNGSALVVHIILYKGDHYLLRQNIEPILTNIDFYSASYTMKISPMYCSLFSPADSTNCVDTSVTTDIVSIYNKIRYAFTLTIPAKMIIENIIFEMIDGVIPYQNDPDSWLTTRKKWCVWNDSTNTIGKVNSAQTETWAFRITPQDFCHRTPKYNMMNFHPYNSNYGMTTPPALELSGVSFNDIFYEMNSLVDFNIGGYVTMTNSNFRRFSNCGAILK